jgi:REP element-mobilizing transposase RayT
VLHVTLKLRSHVPNLRGGKRFPVVLDALRTFRSVSGFRIAHFAVLGDHMHLIVEADSKRDLSRGMQKLMLSVSRRLNAFSVRRHGGDLRHGGPLADRPGWLGRIFRDRYHSRLLRTPTEVRNAIAYVIFNAERHYRSAPRRGDAMPDPYSSASYFDGFVALANFAGLRVPKRVAIGPPEDSVDPPVTGARGWLLSHGWRRSCR